MRNVIKASLLILIAVFGVGACVHKPGTRIPKVSVRGEIDDTLAGLDKPRKYYNTCLWSGPVKPDSFLV